MPKILTLLVLSLIACGQETKPFDHVLTDQPKPEVIINSDFNEYYSQFKLYEGLDPNNISINYADLTSPTVGVCYYTSNNVGNYIEIDSTYWASASDDARQQLVFHELGHCVLSLAHNPSQIVKDNQVVPQSIMFPTVFGDQAYYEPNKEYYFKQLKDKNNTKLGGIK